MSNEKITNVVTLVNTAKTTMIDLIKEVSANVAKADEREKAQELAILQTDKEYAMMRLQTHAALKKADLEVFEKMHARDHEENKIFMAGIGAGFSKVLDIAGNLASRFPIEQLPVESRSVDAAHDRITKVTDEVKDRLDVFKDVLAKMSENLDKSVKKLDETSRMAQSSKDKVEAIEHKMETNGHNKAARN